MVQVELGGGVVEDVSWMEKCSEIATYFEIVDTLKLLHVELKKTS